jgi:hypothetical protein
MSTFQRYFVFALGAAIGCGILGYSITSKKWSKKAQEAVDAQNGYVRVARLLPGQDTNARIPMILDDSVIHVRDYPQHAPNLHKRVIVCAGNDSEPFWRYEEIIWTDPNSDRTKLVSRQKMSANKVLVRINQESCDLKCLREELEVNKMRLANQGHGPNLYQVQLPSHEPDALNSAIDKLKHIKHIEVALPIYLYTVQ